MRYFKAERINHQIKMQVQPAIKTPLKNDIFFMILFFYMVLK